MGNNMDLMSFAKMIIQNNRGNIPNTPWAEAAVNAIMNNDAQAGQAIANNLCNSYGVSREDALQQAKQLFNFR